MFGGVEDIRELYRLNTARLEAWDETLRLEQHPAAFVERHRDLETQLRQRQARGEAHRQEPDLHLVKHKVLSSLHTHWDGLTVFVGRPEVAMDNKSAERILRNPVVGRKHDDGSGRVWSAHLAAMLFSVIQTALLWGLNPHHGLHTFLQACADHGGQRPTDLSAFLPWQMTLERREELARPVPVPWLPLASPTSQREESEAADTS
jgi:transposase